MLYNMRKKVGTTPKNFSRKNTRFVASALFIVGAICALLVTILWLSKTELTKNQDTRSQAASSETGSVGYVKPKTRLGFSWAYPGTGDSRQSLPHGNWDVVGSASGQEAIAGRHWLTNTAMWPQVKDAIAQDIADLLVRIGTDVKKPNESPDFVNRRHAVVQVFNFPALLFANNPSKITLFIDRAFEVARQTDAPIAIKLTNFHWWDWQGCPTCWEDPQKKDTTGCWDPTTPESCRLSKFNWNTDVEWWGWDSRFSWAKECEVGNPEKSQNGKCPNWQTPETNFTWRNWGTLFAVNLPHPRFDSPRYLERVKRVVATAAQAIKKNNNELRRNNQSHLFAAFIPEAETAYGWSFHPLKKAGSEFGVRRYIEKHCPDDTLKCLPPKPENISKEEWIRIKSEEYYRPDGFEWELIAGMGEYTSTIVDVAQRESGLPDEQIITHTSTDQQYHKNQDYFTIVMTDAALNRKSAPGYSVYGSDISSEKVMNYLKSLYSQRNIKRMSWVEYFDYALDANTWKNNFQRFTTTPGIPFIDLVVITNWESVLKGGLGRFGDARENARHAAVIPFAREYISQWPNPTCGNGILESGEQCEFVPPETLNPGAELFPSALISCKQLLGEKYSDLKKAQCLPTCRYDASQCN